MEPQIDNTLKYKNELDKIFEVSWADYKSKFEDFIRSKSSRPLSYDRKRMDAFIKIRAKIKYS